MIEGQVDKCVSGDTKTSAAPFHTLLSLSSYPSIRVLQLIYPNLTTGIDENCIKNMTEGGQ